MRVQNPAYRSAAILFIIYIMKNKEKIPISKRIDDLLTWTVHFITDDIWRITESEVSGLKVFYYNAIKTVVLAVRGFINQELQTKASALTFSTVLSIVPLLAVILGIAKGFGFQETVSILSLDHVFRTLYTSFIAWEHIEFFYRKAF